jgi:hypothetical protein
MYYTLLEDVLHIETCFDSIDPSSGNILIHMVLRKLLYLQRIRCLIKFPLLSVMKYELKLLNVKLLTY